ncbi:MAG: aminotransferase class I/II-fold pyridoxal phosphate-dependent enzyme [Chlorobia bacterium]|nr:aminotransferase class I/II-fold pyridoxal phosphate-dependent enzyme [Fimbriimonadaceae bacterium]
MPEPSSIVSAIPATTPFVGPETLEREMRKHFELRLGANESLFGASPLAIEAMQRQAAIGHFYGDPEGFELRSEIAARHDCAIQNVVLGSGIDELLMLFCRAYLPVGDSALTTFGSYPTFEYAVQSVGGKLLYDIYSDAGTIDLESMAHFALVDAPQVLYLANPDNPSGTWHGPDAIAEFRSQLHRDILFLLDEAYSDFAPEVAPFDPSDTGLVRLRTFSKGHGMAGIRIGFALCHAEHVSALNKIRMHFGVSSVAQAGALASLRDEDHLARVVSETIRVRDWLAKEMLALGFPSLPSQTNFLTIQIGSKERAEDVLLGLRKQSVFIRKPMKALDDHIRVSIGPQSVMEEFLERFRKVCPF